MGWPRLSKAQQEEVNGAIVMFEAATDQGHAQAGHVLGCMYQMGQGVYATSGDEAPTCDHDTTHTVKF